MPRTESDHIRFDWAMKRLLRQKANFEILEGFVSEVIGIDIKIVEILESKSNQPEINAKYNEVDILAKSQNGELILIEVQNDTEYDYFHRMNFGQARLISENIVLKAQYTEVKKVYSINVIYFELGQGDDYFYEGKTTFKGKHTGNLLNLSSKQKELFNIDKVSDIFPEYYLIKVNNFDDIAKSTLDEWIYFLKNNAIEENFKAKGIQKASEVLQTYKLTKQEKIDYNAFIKSYRIEMGVIESLKFDALYEAREEAKAFKLEAETFKNEAETFKNEAETFKNEAETFKNEAETFKNEAETLKNEAETLKNEAETLKIQKENEKKQKELALAKEKEKSFKFAEKMVKYGESAEEIMEETGLSREEIEDIKKKM